MNDLYRDYIVTSVKKMLFLSEDAEKCTHEGVKGRLREIFVEELLEPYLYPSMKICTGLVIDSYNNTSNQIDIIIYDSEMIPPAFLKKESGYIPYESVLATIEVKSKLTSVKLKEAIDNGISIKKLNFSKSFINNYKNSKIPTPMCTVFAFKSDLKGERKTELTRLLDYIQTTGYKAPISSLCIAKKELLMYGRWVENLKDDKGYNNWISIISNPEYEEILCFIGSLIDMCNILKRERETSFIQDYFVQRPDIKTY